LDDELLNRFQTNKGLHRWDQTSQTWIWTFLIGCHHSEMEITWASISLQNPHDNNQDIIQTVFFVSNKSLVSYYLFIYFQRVTWAPVKSGELWSSVKSNTFAIRFSVA
jgi:hypothetical protein